MSDLDQTKNLIQNSVLVIIAVLLSVIVFALDLHTDNSVAVAGMYSMVILYSWLLPGKYSSIFAALICSFLTVFAALEVTEINEDPGDLTQVNTVISLVVIWICVIMVFIAKSSFASLEIINKQLSESSVSLLEKVTELDQKTEELSENKRMLEQLNEDLSIKNRELERFTNIASHDLQEPLRTIGNMTSLIKKKYYSNFDDQGKRILDYVTNATNRMSHLIKGLFEFSRIGSSRKIENVDCQDLVENIVMDFNAALDSSQGQIVFDRLPRIQGNPIELRMLFQNLISNGLKFRKSDETPVIEIFARDNGEYLEFCVKDNGIGIEKSDYEKIFFIFQRLHSEEEFEGTGLGLAYCRKIVELHGGKIWVDSTKDVGTSFYFTLKKIS